MKACVLSAPAPVTTQPLQLREIPSPELAADEVRIAVSACAICRTDLHVVEGELPERRRPVIPGHQVVGRVTELGTDVTGLSLGQRVGVAWLHRTCGTCRFCRSGRENLCESADFTGWTVDGGFATEVKARAAFTYPLPDDLSDLAAAPLLCAGIIEQNLHTKNIREMGGLIRTMPVTAIAFLFCAFSVMGIPPFGGFFGKYLVISGAVESGQWWIALVFVVGAFMTIVYLLRLFNMIFLGDLKKEAKEGSPVMVACVAVLAVLALVSGILISPSAEFARTAVQQMLGTGQ